jgi:putative transposase
MPNYGRALVPGGTFFLTVVTFQRRQLFNEPEHVDLLRKTVAGVQQEYPFDFPAAVILPDHAHFLWTLPPGDSAYSQRVGLVKLRFTQALLGEMSASSSVSASRRKHRERDVWQRRFWEHTIRDEEDFEQHVEYIHYNPVKHGWVKCPHQWQYSSFAHHVKKGIYSRDWGCACNGVVPSFPHLEAIAERAGEWA